MIYHIINHQDWQGAKTAGVYTPPSLESEGFIHFSRAEQVVGTAQFLYADQPILLLLEVDEAKVVPELIYERAADVGDMFPHLYGALNLDAVVRVLDFSADSNNIFHLPDEL